LQAERKTKYVLAIASGFFFVCLKGEVM
jgi:hypothetical protein